MAGAAAKAMPPIPVLIGICALLIPYGWDNWTVFWSEGHNGQAPIVIAAAAYAGWLDYRDSRDTPGARALAIGAGLILAGWIAFVLGRAGHFYQLEGAALPLIGGGLAMSYGGAAAVRRLAVILTLLLFAIPLPGSLADALLVPLKSHITNGAVALLAQAGYPISANGVVIYIGFVELQIADACSGLWSLISLVAVGLIYAYFVRFRPRWANALFIVFIPLIALLTNFLRVIFLTLVAYHFGYDGEATAHDLAAYVELATSLLLFFAWHAVLAFAADRKGRDAVAR